MGWFFLALLGYAALAVVLVLDKFILEKSLDKPVVYTFYSTIFMGGAVLALPFGGGVLQGIDWLWATLSGVTFGLALWTMFIAVQKEEATKINPFIGAVITLWTLLFATVFLSEVLGTKQIMGVLLLVASTGLFFFSVEGKKGNTWWHGFAWGILSGLLFAISHTSAKYIYDLYPFLTGFVWTRVPIALVGLGTLFSPAVWATFKRTPKTAKSIVQCKEKGMQKTAHTVAIVTIDKVLGVVAAILLQYAIALGSVTVVNALVGVQYVLMFLFVLLLSRFFPTFFKEDITKREFSLESIAIVVVLIGSALFVL